jgi:hypothetical protein
MGGLKLAERLAREQPDFPVALGARMGGKLAPRFGVI